MLRLILAGTALSLVALAAPVPSVTFNKDVLPILQKNCQTCHRPGEAAPMTLVTYSEARPWAKAIKNAVLSRKMPPWFADPQYGHFVDDRSLKQSEIDTIASGPTTALRKATPRTRRLRFSGRRAGRSNRTSS